MACKCINYDGTPAQTCNGTCGKPVIIQDLQERAVVFGEMVQEQIRSLSNQVGSLQFRIDESYKKGFEEGFMLGFDKGRNYADY